MDERTGTGGFTGTEAITPDAAHRLVQALRLRVISGADDGEVFASTAERATVGTHRSNDLVLHDKTVSRFHCELTAEGGRVRLRDLGSRNGTFVDAVAVVEAPLRDGCVITIGRSQLRCELGAEPVAIRLSGRDRIGGMVGRSTLMRAVFAQLERAARSDVTVLLEGETGTGKEAAALAIHQEGERAEQPFVVVDCGALPHNLLESELFGHEQGAFTGATSAREGAFEAAQGGTVFLDEIGELAIDLQPKLLRVIERREVKRLGSSKYRPVDVRIIAATHRDLRAMVNERELRSDLFYRLAVLIIRLPALRERREDVPLISEKLLEELGVEGSDAALLREPAFLAELARHEWPGNVRELRNHLERCLVMQEQTRPAGGGEPREDLTLELDRPLKEAREAWSRAFERRYLTRLLERAGGNVSAAARVAQVDRMYLYRLLWRHGLK